MRASIWAVGFPVCPALLVPARFVSHAPAASRALYSIPQLAALPVLAAWPRDRSSIQAIPLISFCM